MSTLSATFPAHAAIAGIQEACANGIHSLLASFSNAYVAARNKAVALSALGSSYLTAKRKLTGEERISRRRFRDALMLQRMANSVEGLEPNLAAELHALAARD